MVPQPAGQSNPRQRKAWDNLVKEFGEEARYLEWPSAREACEAGVKAMQDEANKLMNNPNVQEAFDYFISVCKLCKEQEEK